MAVTNRLLTADEFFDMPDDRLQHELVRGEVRTMSPGGTRNTRIGMRLGRSLDSWVEAHQLGEVWIGDAGFWLERDPDTVRVPDVCFIRRERLNAIGDLVGFWPEAPDLVVEVISPTDRYTEVDEKIQEWLAAGARLVLVVNPRRQVVRECRPGGSERVLQHDDVLDGGEVVPGWQMPVRELFVGLARK